MATTPTRLFNGLSTEKITNPLGMFPLPNRGAGRICVYENDFNTYAAGDYTVVAGGAGSAAALAAGAGGWLVLTTATSGTEAITGNPSFNFTSATSSAAGLQTWFEARVLLDATVAQPDYTIGLTKGALTTINSATDGVYFTKATTATSWSLVIKAAAGATTTIVLPNTTPVASAIIDLAYYFDGKGMFYIYFNKALVGTYGSSPNGATGSLGSSLVNLPASTILMGPTLLNAFHTGTSLLTADYLLAAVEIAR